MLKFEDNRPSASSIIEKYKSILAFWSQVSWAQTRSIIVTVGDYREEMVSHECNLLVLPEKNLGKAEMLLLLFTHGKLKNVD